MKEKTTRRRSTSRGGLGVAREVGASGDSELGASVLRKKSLQRCAIFFFADHRALAGGRGSSEPAEWRVCQNSEWL